MKWMIHSYDIYPEAPKKGADVFYRECMKKHDGKIPVAHHSDREFMCDLFLHDVKIRHKLNEFISDTPVKEKLLNFFL
jgi:hypothetical protein